MRLRSLRYAVDPVAARARDLDEHCFGHRRAGPRRGAPERAQPVLDALCVVEAVDAEEHPAGCRVAAELADPLLDLGQPSDRGSSARSRSTPDRPDALAAERPSAGAGLGRAGRDAPRSQKLRRVSGVWNPTGRHPRPVEHLAPPGKLRAKDRRAGTGCAGRSRSAGRACARARNAGTSCR